MSNLAFVLNKWPSGDIRGRQIAERIGAHVCNGIVKPENTTIFIKLHPTDDIIEHIDAPIYVDVVDSIGVVDWLESRPSIGVIAISRLAYSYLTRRLPKHRIVLIPEHHCNFECAVRPLNRPVKRVGYCGYDLGLQLDISTLSAKLLDVGLELVMLAGKDGTTDFGGRSSVCEFYKSIDIQVCFRKEASIADAEQLKNPLKLANAGSFAIPTVAYPEASYTDEFDGCFLHARTINEVVIQCAKLKRDVRTYVWMASASYTRASDYHIDKIAPLYERLDNDTII